MIDNFFNSFSKYSGEVWTKFYNGELWSNYKSQSSQVKEKIYKNTRDLTCLAGIVGLAAGKYFGNKTSLFLGSFFSGIVSIGAFTYQTYDKKPSDNLKWPKDKLGLNTNEIDVFETSYNNVHRAAGNSKAQIRSVRFVDRVNGQPIIRRKLVATEQEAAIAIANLPFTCEIDSEHCFIMPKKVHKEGLSKIKLKNKVNENKQSKRKLKNKTTKVDPLKRNLRRCHDLYKDKAYVRKKCTSPVEKWFTKKIIEIKPRGIENILKIREVQTKKQVVEEIIAEDYPHTLESFTTQMQNLTFAERLRMIQDLAHGLHFIHELDKDEIYPLFSTNPSFFHSNINPRHVLIRKNEDKYEAVLTDFRMDPKTLKCEFGYKSPETAKLYKEVRFHDQFTPQVDEEMLQHNRESGQKRDVWQLGLVIIKILAPSHGRTAIECIETALQREFDREPEYLREGRIGDITQNQLQKSLHDLELSIFPAKKKHECTHAERKEHELYTKMWQLVRKMLQVDPKVRYSSQQVLDEINKLAALT